MSSIGPLMIDLLDETMNAEEKKLLQHPLVGGVIFFSRHYRSPQQLKQLIADIRQINPNLLIAVDQEGGRVQRFKTGFSLLPDMGSLGKLYAVDQRRACDAAEQIAWLMASELLACGLDFSFAPVLDLDCGHQGVVGNRAFHADEKIVTVLAQHFVKGMKQAGMSAVGKHFPGHGSVTLDSHVDMPVCELVLDDPVLQSALAPFAALSKSDIAAMMPAHICFSNIDKEAVGCSTFWLQQVLRHQLGFAGAIFSDDMNMSGAAAGGDYQKRCQLALEAGCDMVLLCNNREAVKQVLSGLNDCRDQAAQQRLLAMKRRASVDEVMLKSGEAWHQARQTAEAVLALAGCDIDVD